MKKVMIAVFALALASPVMAAVGIELGTNWYKVNYTDYNGDHLMGQGENILVTWGLDNDLSIGAYSENVVLSNSYGSSYSSEVMAIQIAKGIVKGVALGLNVGQAYNDWVGNSMPITDVFASVVILSGASDKVTGTVKATVAARYSKDVYGGSDYDMSGLNVGLAIGLGF